MCVYLWVCILFNVGFSYILLLLFEALLTPFLVSLVSAFYFFFHSSCVIVTYKFSFVAMII